MKSEPSPTTAAAREGASSDTGDVSAHPPRPPKPPGPAGDVSSHPPRPPILPSPLASREALLAPRPSELATLDVALLRGALEEIPFGVATMRGGTILYANDALSRIYGVRQGGLELKHFAQLFPERTYAQISQRLDEARVFDGRVSARSFDGRPIEAEVHIEWYSSEAQGIGGFLVVRDVTFELGALGRLVDHIGAALFRISVPNARLELVSPAITKLTGLDPALCTQHPVLLTALVSAEERERVMFLYRRLALGEIPLASAQVSLKRHDGTVCVLQLRATARRDTSGVVRYIDGVVSDAAREAPLHDGSTSAEGRLRARSAEGGGMGAATRQDASSIRDPLASAAMDLSHELLREASQHIHSLGRELRAVRTALRAQAARLPPGVVDDLALRLDSAASVTTGASALNRSVRRVLAGATTLGAPLAEVLENVRATLTPLMSSGDHALVVDAGDAATAVVPERIEELGAAVVYLALRAFRFAGSGTLRIMARCAEPLSDGPHVSARLARAPIERTHIVIEILGTAPADLAETAVEISSDVLRSISRPGEADGAYQAAQTLIAAVGGLIESDDATFSTARSVIRLQI